MANPNEYLVFEADQVLTNEHLNQLFYYIDQQNRWTRNRLIGIGIACGLNIVPMPGIIRVTKGCAVTSQGYLILHETTNYSYYLPYTPIQQPDSLPFSYPEGLSLPFYKSYLANKRGYILINDDEYNKLEDNKKKQAQTISSATFLSDYAVVLFLEAAETELKNCDVFDCNDKGGKVNFEVRPLLIKKTELPDAAKRKVGKAGSVQGEEKLVAPEINFKRFNVPYTNLEFSEDVLNSFVKIADDDTLSTVSRAYTFCYEKYKPLLNISSNPFTTLFADLKNQRDSIIKTYPVFIQYFYDFIDDLIKAYYEFRVKAYELIATCCPNENLFPLHVVLGAATANTSSFERDALRNYFLYSPLFQRLGNEASEVVFLFMRMQILTQQFTVLRQKTLQESDIKITPSQYEHQALSKRSIPYFYKVNEKGSELYKYWNYSKTTHGNDVFNLSYHSNLYNRSPGIIQPLLYDVEYYNFFRIEGHIGLSYRAVLADLLQQRQEFNLPFDVLAISAEKLSSSSDDLPECYFQDLETDYKLIISEFASKVHAIFCYLTTFPYPPPKQVSTVPTSIDEAPKFSAFKKDAVARFNKPVTFYGEDYKKGDFMRKYCTPKKGTAGSAYLDLLEENGSFSNTLKPDQSNPIVFSYYYIFEFIDL